MPSGSYVPSKQGGKHAKNQGGKNTSSKKESDSVEENVTRADAA